MSRRVSLPTADDLFRSTQNGHGNRERSSGRSMSAVRDHPQSVAPVGEAAKQPVAEATAVDAAAAEREEARARRSSGRVRHDEKMTVYVTADELLEIEHARLSLRRDQGLAVDRGRLVREAIAIVLADLELNGDDSVLVQRLIGR